MLIAVNYHYVRPKFDLPFPGIHGITPTQFESQMRLLGQAGEFVRAEDVVSAARGGPSLPDRAIIITFDDGLREQYEHAWPVLDRLGIPAVFFLNTGPIEHRRVSAVHQIHILRANTAPAKFVSQLEDCAASRGIVIDVAACEAQGVAHYKYDMPTDASLKYALNFSLPPADRDSIIADMFKQYTDGDEAAVSRRLYMDGEQIATLGAKEMIGSHGHEHLPIGLLNAADRDAVVARASELLCEWTGHMPCMFSYPYGSREACSLEAATTLAQHGFDVAFTMERAANSNLTRPLHLARFDNNDAPGGKSAKWSIEEWFAKAPSACWFGGKP